MATDQNSLIHSPAFRLCVSCLVGDFRLLHCCEVYAAEFRVQRQSKGRFEALFAGFFVSQWCFGYLSKA